MRNGELSGQSPREPESLLLPRHAGERHGPIALQSPVIELFKQPADAIGPIPVPPIVLISEMDLEVFEVAAYLLKSSRAKQCFYLARHVSLKVGGAARASAHPTTGA